MNLEGSKEVRNLGSAKDPLRSPTTHNYLMNLEGSKEVRNLGSAKN